MTSFNLSGNIADEIEIRPVKKEETLQFRDPKFYRNFVRKLYSTTEKSTSNNYRWVSKNYPLSVKSEYTIEKSRAFTIISIANFDGNKFEFSSSARRSDLN